MSAAEDTIQAILGLVIGGIIFILFGRALSDTALNGSGILLNFEFWGFLYIFGAIVIAVTTAVVALERLSKP